MHKHTHTNTHVTGLRAERKNHAARGVAVSCLTLNTFRGACADLLVERLTAAATGTDGVPSTSSTCPHLHDGGSHCYCCHCCCRDMSHITWRTHRHTLLHKHTHTHTVLALHCLPIKCSRTLCSSHPDSCDGEGEREGGGEERMEAEAGGGRVTH